MLPSSSAEVTNEAFTEIEVVQSLQSLKNSAPGLDLLPPWVFRTFADVLGPSVTLIFNRSISTNKFPFLYKCAVVSPIPKTLSPGPDDFRPISLLPVLAKVLERLVVKKLLLPCVKNKLDPLQFAFTPGPGKGTTTALVKIYNELVSFLDQPGTIRLLQLDFSKAFDSISHHSIITAVHELGLAPSGLSWIYDYLNLRCQMVRSGSTSSSWTAVTSGVPQGSVLGPLLFAITINSFCPVHKDRTLIVKYADDITIIHKIRPGEADLAAEELENVAISAENVGLRLNEKKCSVLTMSSSRKLSPSSNILLRGSHLAEVKSVKILGITFSTDLKWKIHITSILSKARRLTGLCMYLKRSGCSIDWCWRVYVSLIRSVVLYAFPAWCNAPKTLLAQLKKMESRLTKALGSPPKTSMEDASLKLCTNLAIDILSSPDHPLHSIFDNRSTRKSERFSAKKSLVAPFAFTRRFKDSFISYASVSST
jgi:hypothetical protein